MPSDDLRAHRRSVETARAILTHALAVFPGKKSLWRRAATLEKAHGSREALDALLERAVKYCPQVRGLGLQPTLIPHQHVACKGIGQPWFRSTLRSAVAVPPDVPRGRLSVLH